MLSVEIRARGGLAPHWASWFEGLEIVQRGEEMVLYGRVPDQSALYGLLSRLRDLGLELISVDSHEATGGDVAN
ncbi:MAG: hypothetical protein JXA74_17620 [Anaerolineae bacterium]|nr:hypothetical protein [Anaerolineae bacterium]